MARRKKEALMGRAVITLGIAFKLIQIIGAAAGLSALSGTLMTVLTTCFLVGGLAVLASENISITGAFANDRRHPPLGERALPLCLYGNKHCRLRSYAHHDEKEKAHPLRHSCAFALRYSLPSDLRRPRTPRCCNYCCSYLHIQRNGNRALRLKRNFSENN